MKILFSIILNGLILFVMTYLLSANAEKGIVDGVVLWCQDCHFTSLAALKTYLVWGMVLWLMNITIKPVLKILSFPLVFLFLWLVSFLINGVVLFLFSYIMNDLLIVSNVWYEIQGTVNFIIAVAIFTILNTLYSFLSFKK